MCGAMGVVPGRVLSAPGPAPTAPRTLSVSLPLTPLLELSQSNFLILGIWPIDPLFKVPWLFVQAVFDELAR